MKSKYFNFSVISQPSIISSNAHSSDAKIRQGGDRSRVGSVWPQAQDRPEAGDAEPWPGHKVPSPGPCAGLHPQRDVSS